jgi:hypothetical protein
MYADDLLLMAVSVSDLQAMVDICLFEFESIDMVINTKKSICMRIGYRRGVPVSNIRVLNQSLDWASELLYLGVSLVSAKIPKCNLQRVRQKYFRALNGIFGKIGTRSSVAVTLSLINSFCIPVLTYGLDALKLNQSGYNTLESAYSAAFAKIFGSFDANVIRDCQFYCGALPLCFQIDLKRMNFLSNLAKSICQFSHNICVVVDTNCIICYVSITLIPQTAILVGNLSCGFF